MSMSTHVTGFRDSTDENFEKMMSVKLSCEAAGITIPAEVADYFGEDVAESESYLRDSMREIDIEHAVEVFSDESNSGFVVHVRKLPPECGQIRFLNSW